MTSNKKKLRFDSLETFLTLCELGSFSRTAEFLKKSQGAVSQQLSLLEQEVFHCKLINRSSRDFSLTGEGVLVRGFAETVLRLFRQTLNQISLLDDENIGVVRVSASTIPGEYLLPRVISQFKERYPKVDFETVFNNSEKSVDLLLRDKVDLALVGSLDSANIPEDVESIPIEEDELVIVCAPGHPLLQLKFVQFEDLARYPFVVREEGSGSRWEFEKALGERKVEPVLELESNHAIINSLDGTEYLAALSRLVALEAEKAGLVKVVTVVDLDPVKRELYAIRRKKQVDSKILDLFWNFLKDSLKKS
ncbi:MAG: LysR substrate-binding domain-containing protein [Promethearchaeota archaeon]